MNNPMWIWYRGDFELYHGMLQNFQREERGYDWPAFWKMDDWRKNVRFFRFYTLPEETAFTVCAHGQGHVLVSGRKAPVSGAMGSGGAGESINRKYPLGREIRLTPGDYEIEIFLGNRTALPCVYIEGNVIRSDASWMADDFREMHPVGTSSLYTRKDQNPNELCCETEEVEAVSVTETATGTLFDFGRMVNGYPRIVLKNSQGGTDGESATDGAEGFLLTYGESDAEALDPVNCYYKEEHAAPETDFRRRSFRYLCAVGLKPADIAITAMHTYIPTERKVRQHLNSGDEELNQIWETAAVTYELCGGLFFIDGIKRDRWIWGGDAYQSFCVNPYILGDREINKRTMRALRGNLPADQHINTIMDYTMLWILSVAHEYDMDGDILFVREMFPKVLASLRQLASQTEDHGFLCARDRDWTYIDWADIDKEGPISAEQILLWQSYRVTARLARALAESEAAYAGADKMNERDLYIVSADLFPAETDAAGTASAEPSAQPDAAPRHNQAAPQFGPDGRPLPKDRAAAAYAPIDAEERAQLEALTRACEAAAAALRRAINEYYWDADLGAFIDSFVSGRRHVSRHANIFAILYDFADEDQTAAIVRKVLENDAVPAITTPYFKFFELDALGKIGRREEILRVIRAYWGRMLNRGAVTVWEEFDPDKTGPDQYAMYGDPFGKSLCHAWGASPIYLLGKYFANEDAFFIKSEPVQAK